MHQKHPPAKVAFSREAGSPETFFIDKIITPKLASVRNTAPFPTITKTLLSFAHLERNPLDY